MDQRESANCSPRSHRPGDPLILFNAWDAGQRQGGGRGRREGDRDRELRRSRRRRAMATREALPLDLALANAARIAAAVELPVTIDFEGGYASEPERGRGECGAARRRPARSAAISRIRSIGGEGLHAIEEQAGADRRDPRARARRAADFFINARTDIFLKSKAEAHGGQIEEALGRGRAYAEAGADGLFVPGLGDEALIERVCAAARCR